MDAAEAPRACAAPGIVLTHRAGAAGFLGYVRRRATELPAKKCCRGTSDLPRGQPNNLFSKSWFDPGGAAKSWIIPPQVLDSTCRSNLGAGAPKLPHSWLPHRAVGLRGTLQVRTATADTPADASCTIRHTLLHCAATLSQPASQGNSSTMVARTLNAARVYLGTMNFGWAQASSVCDTPVAAEMLKRFAAYGGNRLDTARIYANGKGESLCGR